MQILIAFILVLCSCSLWSQQKVTVKEYKKSFTTYPFSDPDPVPEFKKIYPYYRFDGYTTKSNEKDWKVVELENDYIRIMIMPEIGGKIWTAIEKSTNQPFIYYNEVVKFRDVALRGPWTNGGIEANYGMIGHTPNVATPVDYTIVNKPDGSISCVIGVLDLLTRSTWRLDVNLAKDKAYFTTSSFWYNSSPLEQPYYTWMNAGIKSAGNLQFIHPGTKYLSHEGEPKSWPVSEQGVDLSFYNNNNFGGYKSYHIFGKYSGFYGGYWHDDDFGMGRYASYGGKAGKKVWLWGLSGQGMMWEKLLTDTNGQEVEVQSGRLFNQPQGTSSLTPFKNRGFLPHTTDTWTEYWFPAVKTKGIVTGTELGVLNAKKEKNWLKIYFSPLQHVAGNIKITAGGKELYSKHVDLKPLQLFSDSVKLETDPGHYKIDIADHKLQYNSDPNAGVIMRPAETPAAMDWTTAYGLYLQGREEGYKRNYAAAELKLREAIQKEPFLSPALVELASILYRQRSYKEALELVKKALSVNTYDNAANYYYGLINIKLGNITDAKEALDMASNGFEYRSAAHTLLAGVYLKEKNLNQAIDHARKSIDFNRYAIDAYQQLSVCYRLQGRRDELSNILDTILLFDPINHLALFERMLLKGDEASKNQFTGMIRNEMPHESYLELAIWYAEKGLKEDAIKVLNLSPEHTEVSYWLAFLGNRPLGKLNADLVFPFRTETADVLEKLIATNDHWLLKYHLALIQWHMNQPEKTKELFNSIAGKADYAPFYAARAKFFKGDSSRSESNYNDLLNAARLDPGSWRYGAALINWYNDHGHAQRSLVTAEKYYKLDPNNYLTGMLYAQSLIRNEQYTKAIKVLNSIYILPNEGATDGRDLYKEAQLMVAIDYMKNRNYSKALVHISESRQWPENLGVGRPYDSDIDERLEDWLAYKSYTAVGKNEEAKKYLTKILQFDPITSAYGRHISSANHLVTAWAQRVAGKPNDAGKLQKSSADNRKSRDENYRIINKLLSISSEQ